MPAIARSERVKPCLLDRIVEDEAGAGGSGRLYRAISPERYLKGVMRDLWWLFNTGAPSHDTRLTGSPPDARTPTRADGMPEPCLGDFPQVCQSVLMFGIPDLAGLLRSRLNLGELQEELETAVRRFEPRLNPKTVQVRVLRLDDADPLKFDPALISFEVEGELWMEPVPEHVRIETTIDLETGLCSVAQRVDG